MDDPGSLIISGSLQNNRGFLSAVQAFLIDFADFLVTERNVISFQKSLLILDRAFREVLNIVLCRAEGAHCLLLQDHREQSLKKHNPGQAFFTARESRFWAICFFDGSGANFEEDFEALFATTLVVFLVAVLCILKPPVI